MKHSIVIGASGGLGLGLVKHLAANTPEGIIIALSKNEPPADCPSNVDWRRSGYSQHDIAVTCNDFSSKQFDQIFICHGMLHDKDKHIWPEKRIDDLSDQAALDVYTANVLTPMRWLQQLMPTLRKQERCTVAVFSARVGSIGDNQLGGWYSYRSAKAALNMMLMTLSRELKWKAPGVKLLAIHPGTTDTALSKPFQKNVPTGKLFTAAFVAERVTQICRDAHFDNTLSYVDWQGQDIPW